MEPSEKTVIQRSDPLPIGSGTLTYGFEHEAFRSILDNPQIIREWIAYRSADGQESLLSGIADVFKFVSHDDLVHAVESQPMSWASFLSARLDLAGSPLRVSRHDHLNFHDHVGIDFDACYPRVITGRLHFLEITVSGIEKPIPEVINYAVIDLRDLSVSVRHLFDVAALRSGAIKWSFSFDQGSHTAGKTGQVQFH